MGRLFLTIGCPVKEKELLKYSALECPFLACSNNHVSETENHVYGG